MANPPAGCLSALRQDPRGVCWFRDEEKRNCAIHREFGEDALASACRQFPRVVVLEPDQISVSLSHYCPTAAGLLFRKSNQFGLVDHPAAFPADWPFEGLDARGACSPFLRPGVLLGFDGLRTLEEAGVSAFANHRVGPALSRIEAAIERIRKWTPASGPAPRFVASAFVKNDLAPEGFEPADPRPVLRASTPFGMSSPESLPEFLRSSPALLPEIDLALRRYLAARLIAGWILFQAGDLSSVAAYLRLCFNTVLLFESARDRQEPDSDRFREAIRSADLWLLHYCDPELLAWNLR